MTLIVASVIFILLVIPSTPGLYNENDIFLGVTYILLAVTIPFICAIASKRFQLISRQRPCARLMYGGGHLSELGIYGASHYILVLKQPMRFIG